MILVSDKIGYSFVAFKDTSKGRERTIQHMDLMVKLKSIELCVNALILGNLFSLNSISTLSAGKLSLWLFNSLANVKLHLAVILIGAESKQKEKGKLSEKILKLINK